MAYTNWFQFPETGADSKRCQYSKFHVFCSLIRDHDDDGGYDDSVLLTSPRKLAVKPA